MGRNVKNVGGMEFEKREKPEENPKNPVSFHHIYRSTSSLSAGFESESANLEKSSHWPTEFSGR